MVKCLEAQRVHDICLSDEAWEGTLATAKVGN